MENFSEVNLQSVHRAAIQTEGKQYVDHGVPAASLEQSKKKQLTISKNIFRQMNLQHVQRTFGSVSQENVLTTLCFVEICCHTEDWEHTTAIDLN